MPPTANPALLPPTAPCPYENLVQQFPIGHRLPDLRAAVGAFIGEVELRHAPIGATSLMYIGARVQLGQIMKGGSGSWWWINAGMSALQQGIQLPSPTPMLEGAPQRLIER